VGIEARVPLGPRVDVATRFGYELAVSPVDEQTGFTNYIDRDRHSFSAGFGARISGRALANIVRELSLDVHGQLSTLVERTTQKVDPSDFVGDFSAGGSIINVGMTLTVGFGR
jgi:long-chain fatty acid transport protein